MMTLPNKRPKSFVEEVSKRIKKEKSSSIRNQKCCDFDELIELYKNGKISSEISGNCELLFICRTCRNVFSKFKKFAKHWKGCSQYVNGNSSNADNGIQQNDKERVKNPKPDKKVNETKLDISNLVKKEKCPGLEVQTSYTEREKLENIIKKEKQELFEYVVALNDQVTMMIDVNQYICLKCNTKFQSEVAAQEHVTAMHPEKHKCSLCDFQTKSKKRFKNHLLEFHESADFSNLVSENNRKAPKENELLDEVQIKKETIEGEFESDSIQTLKAEKSEGFFPDKEPCPIDVNDRAVAVKKENGENQSQETKYESYSITLNEEEEKLMDVENLRCVLCDKEFSRETSLRRHLATIHLGYSELHCKFCEFKSSSRKDCLSHVLEIHKESLSRRNIYIYFLQLNCRVKNTRKFKRFLKLDPNGNSELPMPRNINWDKVCKSTIILSEEESKYINKNAMKCLLCNSDKFCKKPILIRHVAVCHLGYRRYKCRFCEFQAHFIHECEKHLNSFHNEECSGKSARMLCHVISFRTM